MTPEDKNKIAELERKVAELTLFMNDKKSQQIKFPLEKNSTTVIAKALQASGYIIT